MPVRPVESVSATEVTVGGWASPVEITGSGELSMLAMLPLCAKALPAASLMPATRAVFSATSSIAAWPFWPATMV